MNTPAILQKLRLLGSAAISDAKAGKDVLDYTLRLRTSEDHLVAGIAETVHILQKSLDPIRALFKKCASNEDKNIIIAIDASGLKGAVWGEIFTRMAKKSNIIGCVIDGGIRDLVDVKKLDFPVWARYVTPRVITGEWATTFSPGLELGSHSHIPVLCGGVLIRPGDFILADLDGVITIRSEEIEEVLEKAEKIRLMEEKMF